MDEASVLVLAQEDHKTHRTGAFISGKGTQGVSLSFHCPGVTIPDFGAKWGANHKGVQ